MHIEKHIEITWSKSSVQLCDVWNNEEMHVWIGHLIDWIWSNISFYFIWIDFGRIESNHWEGWNNTETIFIFRPTAHQMMVYYIAFYHPLLTWYAHQALWPAFTRKVFNFKRNEKKNDDWEISTFFHYFVLLLFYASF